MKKVILCLLLLIPILVILTIDASGKLIASALVDIPAESMLIKHGGEVLESDEINLEDYKDTAKKYTVFCEVFPGIATDEILWKSSNPDVASVTADPKRANAADVTFHDYGSADIICTSKKNSSITARATMYVGGLIPGYMTVGDYENKDLESVTIARYTGKSLLASVKPARSVQESKVLWASSDPQVATVDNNGVVNALKEGETTITATVTAREKTVSDSLKVIVSGEALSTAQVIYATGELCDISSYLGAGVTADGGSEIAIGSLSSFEEVAVTLRKGSVTEEIHVVKLDKANSLEIENYHLLAEGALSSFLALGTSNLELKAFVPNGGATPQYRWRSSDESVIRIEGHRVYAVGSGSAVITPYYDGYVGRSITLQVTQPVEDFRLRDTAFGDKVGLLQERVFGNRTYVNGGYSSQYTMEIASVSPKEAGIEAFTFDSSNPDLATVDDNGVITFARDLKGEEEVTLTATAYNQQGVQVRESYVYHLVDGVNIGVGMEKQYFDRATGGRPSFAPYFDLKAVAADRGVKAIVLHTDVYMAPKAEGGTSIHNMTASIYGNGYKLDGQFFIDSVEEPEKMILWEFDKFTDMPEKVEVEIVNTNLQCTQPTSDDAEKAFTELSTRGGGAIGTLNGYPSGNHSFALKVKGCLFQYAYGHVNIAIGDSEFDGCIFRNNSASAVVLQQSSYGVGNIKIKNCIFSNTIAPVGIACGNFQDILSRIKKEERNSQFGAFELEGTNYVYNWKKLKDVQMDLLPQSLDDSAAASLVNSFNPVLGKIIREAFEESEIENLYVEDIETYKSLQSYIDKKDYLENHAWLNFSFLMLGIWDDLNPQVNNPSSTENGLKVTFDPEIYQMLAVHAEAAPSISSALKFAKMMNIDIEKNMTYHIVCRDQKGAFNTAPGDTYTIDTQTYARLRGEIVAA